MFLSYRSAPENDENNVISRVAASLKIERSHLKAKLLTEVLYQPKYSPDRKLLRTYHNRYYQVFKSDFSDILKQPEFTLDGTKYKWMTLEEMWEDNQIKAVLREVMSNCINLAKGNAKNDQYPIAAIVTDREGCVLATSSSSLRKKMIRRIILKLRQSEKLLKY